MAKLNLIARFATIGIAVAGITGLAQVLKIQAQQVNDVIPAPPVAPPEKPFAKTLAATGIVEAWGENVALGVPVPGLVTEVAVQVNDRVDVGQKILQLDDRDLRASLLTSQAEVAAAKAEIGVATETLAKTKDFLNRMTALKDNRVISQDEMSNRQFDEKIAEAQLASVQAKLAKAEAAQKRDELLLERLTVRAPRKGTILQVNVRAGEYASVQGNQALILMGDLSAYQIRADVDEQNAGRVVSGKPAKAYLKGDTKTALPLSFVRVEPYVIPKQSLTGASTERVDTRVLQVIYRLDASPTLRAYVGQQVDVFIEAE